MTREPAIAEAIAGVVATYRLRRVPLRELLTAAASVDRTAAAAVGWRTRVLAALTALAEEGRIELPRKLDRSAHPPLPAYVTRPAAERPLPPPDTAVVWHADLDWAARRDDNGELGSADRRLLAAINAWLPRRRGVRVPMRERSLEIFDDEKILENVVISPLFGRQRLSFDLLETFLAGHQSNR